jgi:hypothetical protein
MSAARANFHSIFANTFTIPSITIDLSGWDTAWDGFPSLSASQDVFPIMSEIVKIDEPGSSPYSENMPKRLHAQVCRIQLLISKLWAELDNTWVSVASMTLKVEDRKNHMLNGMKEACEYALCPDIMISSMIKDQGQGFTNFVEGCTEAVEKSGPDRVHLLWG